MGLCIKLADLLTVQIRNMFQVIDIPAQIDPKIKMPQAREKLFGTKAGKKATAYTAALTLVRLVTNPNLNEPHEPGSFRLSKSNLPNPNRNEYKVCNETITRNATPAHFNTAYANSDVAKIADNPIALEILHVRIPAQLPSDDIKAALLPPRIDCRKTIATPWPGTITNNKVATAKAGMLASKDQVRIT